MTSPCIARFATKEDQDAYQTNPAHLAVAETVRASTMRTRLRRLRNRINGVEKPFACFVGKDTFQCLIKICEKLF